MTYVYDQKQENNLAWPKYPHSSAVGSFVVIIQSGIAFSSQWHQRQCPPFASSGVGAVALHHPLQDVQLLMTIQDCIQSGHITLMFVNDH